MSTVRFRAPRLPASGRWRGPLEECGPLEPPDTCACWPARRLPCGRRGMAGPHGDPEGLPDLAPSSPADAVGTIRSRRSRISATRTRQGGSEWTIPSERRIADDEEASLCSSSSTGAAGEVGRSRPASTTTSASRAPSAAATAGQTFSLATAPATPGDRRGQAGHRGVVRRVPDGIGGECAPGRRRTVRRSPAVMVEP